MLEEYMRDFEKRKKIFPPEIAWRGLFRVFTEEPN